MARKPWEAVSDLMDEVVLKMEEIDQITSQRNIPRSEVVHAVLQEIEKKWGGEVKDACLLMLKKPKHKIDWRN